MKPSYLALAFPLLAACGGSGDSTPAVEEPSGPTLRIDSDSYTLQPGEEKYFCYASHLPAKTTITEIMPVYGQGTHHILFAQTIAPEPEGFSACNVLFKTTWIPLYLGGFNSSPLSMPADSGMTLAKGQQVLLQLHLQNPSDRPITAKTSMILSLSDGSKTLTPAGIFGFDNRAIDVPPHSDNVGTSMTCNVDKDMDVFAVLPHMHKHGEKIDFFKGKDASGDLLYTHDWNFEEQPVSPVTFHMKKGDPAYLQCAHRNQSDVAVPYGESSDQEMCAFILYYTPFDGLDGCVHTGG